MQRWVALQHATLFWRDNVVRGLLSIVGVVVGIVGLSVASAIDRGAQEELAQVARSSGTALVRVATAGHFSATIAQQLQTTLAPRLRTVAAYSTATRQVSHRNRSIATGIIAVQPSYQNATSLDTTAGRFIAALDLDRGAQVIVINAVLARALLPFASQVGVEILVDALWYRVVGVVADGSGEPVGYVPLQTREPQNLVARFGSEQVMRDSLQDLQRALRVRARGLDPALDIVVPVDAIREQQQVRRLVKNVLGGFAMLVLGLGGLGVANVMLLNVVTRSREIALRRALGARARDIILQFSAETAVICGVGGVLALLCAPLCSLLLMALLDWPLRFDFYVVVVALLATAVVAAAASVVPARRAVMVPPAQGLA